MKSSLQTLTRIQKFKIDEQRKILVEFQNQEETLQHRLDALNQEFEQEKKTSLKLGLVGDFGAYVKRYLKTKESLENQLAAVRQKIEEIREIIADMFKEQKTYEIVDRERKQREEKELSDKEQKMLDEIGTNTYIKKHKES